MTEAALEKPAAVEVDERREGSSAQQWYMVGVLTTIYTVNFLDRGVLNLIVNPIREDLGISDVQISYLLGLSFMLLYSLLSIPAGYLADIVSRRVMIAGAVMFWSAMETLCGFAGSYWQLFTGRIGLGIGEAALPPAAFSLIRDGVAEKHRARAFSIYGVAPILGSGAGALIGGTLYGAASHGLFAHVPVISHLKAWQIVIAVPGLIGLPLSLLLLTVREPRRVRLPGSASSAPSFGEMFRYLRASWRLYLLLLLAVSLVSLAAGFNSWLAAALSRMWGLSPATIGRTIGPMGLILSPIAFITIGTLMDRWKRRTPDGPLRVSIIGSLLNIGPVVGILLAPTLQLAWISLGISMVLTGAVQISCGTVLANITPSRLMGKVTALYFLLSNLLGLALGPTFYALVAQQFFSGKLAIVDSMLVCYPALMIATVVLLVLAARETRSWYRRNSESS